MAISMLKIRRPLGRLIFNMGIAIPGKTVFLIETAPWIHPISQPNPPGGFVLLIRCIPFVMLCCQQMIMVQYNIRSCLQILSKLSRMIECVQWIVMKTWASGKHQDTWWRHQMETLLALCAGNSPVPGEFPAQRPVTRIFDVLFDLRFE